MLDTAAKQWGRARPTIPSKPPLVRRGPVSQLFVGNVTEEQEMDITELIPDDYQRLRRSFALLDIDCADDETLASR